MLRIVRGVSQVVLRMPQLQTRCRLRHFEAYLPERQLDNFRVMYHTDVLRHAEEHKLSPEHSEAHLAVSTLKHLPDAYEDAARLGYLGQQKACDAVKVKVYSPFDLYTSSRLKPLDGAAAGDSGLSVGLQDLSMSSANPLFGVEISRVSRASLCTSQTCQTCPYSNLVKFKQVRDSAAVAPRATCMQVVAQKQLYLMHHPMLTFACAGTSCRRTNEAVHCEAM